jgi:hypothetical protein
MSKATINIQVKFAKEVDNDQFHLFDVAPARIPAIGETYIVQFPGDTLAFGKVTDIVSSVDHDGGHTLVTINIDNN